MKRVLSITGLLLLCLAIFVYAFYPERGVELSVLNMGGKSIYDVEFNYRGEILKFDTIESGGKRFGKIMPHAGGHLMLEFRGFDGKTYSKDVDIYVVKGDIGRIDVLIGEHGKVERRLNIQR